MEIHLHITEERLDTLTVNEVIAVQGLAKGRVDVEMLRDTIARFLVGPDDQYLPEDQARATLGGLTRAEFRQVLKQFAEKMDNTAVNPMTGVASS